MRELKKQDLELVADYFLHDLAPEELQQLEERMASDVEVRRQFAEIGRDEWMMHHVHHMANCRIIHVNPRRSMKRRIRAIAAGVALVATLGTLFWSQSTTISRMVSGENQLTVLAQVSDCFVLEGEAISVVNQGKVRRLESGSNVCNGDRIVVPPGCSLAFQYLNEATLVRLSGNSLFHISQQEGSKHIRLDHGRLVAQVAKQAQGHPMRVATSDSSVEVLGTAFELFYNGSTQLAVTKGAVRFNSFQSGKSMVVKKGYFAASNGDADAPCLFLSATLNPEEDRTLNRSVDPRYIVVDAARNCQGYLKFDLGAYKGRIVDARLRLKVMGWHSDQSGGGELRVFRIFPHGEDIEQHIQIAHFSGGAEKGKTVEIDLDPTTLSHGENNLLLSLNAGGNDFWFSSSQGKYAPVLELKVAEK